MIYVALAAYNEEKNIGDLMRALDDARQKHRLEMEVVLVDDGSLDDTADVVRGTPVGMRVHLVSQANAGFTRALENAIKLVLNLAHEGDICVTMDADNTHPADLIAEMTAEICRDQDVVIASRFQRGGGMIGVPFFRRLLSTAARLVLRMLIPVRGIRDYTVAYRAYRVSVLRKLFADYPVPLAGRGFSGIAGLLIRLSYVTERISEVPLMLRYDYKRSRSSLKLFDSLSGYWHLIFGYRKGLYKPGQTKA